MRTNLACLKSASRASSEVVLKRGGGRETLSGVLDKYHMSTQILSFTGEWPVAA